jgi:hypothetical protein
MTQIGPENVLPKDIGTDTVRKLTSCVLHENLADVG